MILKKLWENVVSLNIVVVDLYEFELHSGNLIGMVYLQDKICSCNAFMLDGQLCVHVVVV